MFKDIFILFSEAKTFCAIFVKGQKGNMWNISVNVF